MTNASRHNQVALFVADPHQVEGCHLVQPLHVAISQEGFRSQVRQVEAASAAVDLAKLRALRDQASFSELWGGNGSRFLLGDRSDEDSSKHLVVARRPICRDGDAERQWDHDAAFIAACVTYALKRIEAVHIRDLEGRIRRYFEENIGATRTECAAALRIDRRTVWKHLRRMQAPASTSDDGMNCCHICSSPALNPDAALCVSCSAAADRGEVVYGPDTGWRARTGPALLAGCDVEVCAGQEGSRRASDQPRVTK